MQKLYIPIFFLILSSSLCLKFPGDQKFEPPTPHINAPKGAFAKTVLMPGDPKRARYIAEKFLQDAKLVNDVRGVQGYTGYYKGVKVSVMASGMGMPTMGIYSYELFNAYDVENIIRVGSIGAINENIQLKDIIVGMSASTNSNYGSNFNLNGIISGAGSYKIIKTVDKVVEKMGLQNKAKFGQILSSDTFYTDEPGNDLNWAKMGVMGVEMEGYSLYLNAARAGKNALVLATVSDHLIKKQYLSADERQFSFDEMITVALETACNLE
jgi:purine-nucleoside phosphorylase